MPSYLSRIKPNGEQGPEYKLKDEELREVVQSMHGEVTETDTKNSTLFLYRETPYEADRVFLDELVGGSVVANQLVQNGDFSNGTTSWQLSDATASVSGGVCSVTPTASGINLRQLCVRNKTTHKILVSVFVKSTSSGIMVAMQNNAFQFNRYISGSGNWEHIIGIYTSVESDEVLCFHSDGTAFQVKDCNIVDLTQLFGSDTIPNNALTKEQSSAGSGIQWLKDNGFDFSNYIPNNAGTTESVNPSGKKVVGFNQWNEEWELGDYNDSGQATSVNYCIRSKQDDYIPVLGNTVYYSKCPENIYPCFYDINKTFISKIQVNANTTFTTPANAKYMRFVIHSNYGTIYNNDICINISKTTGTPKNGDYVPYEEKIYSITQSPLHGLFKLDNDKIVADGDIRKSDGGVSVDFIEYNLGDYNWVYYNNIFYHTFGVGTIMKNTKDIVCSAYISNPNPPSLTQAGDKLIWVQAGATDGTVVIDDRSYTDATAFKAHLQSIDAKLIVRKATPTTLSATPFTNPQICYKDGTEEFIDNRDFPVPVGHNSTYANLPSMMDGDFLNYMAKNFASEEYVDHALEEVDTELDTKVDKVAGKGLSTNDYTNEEKALVETIPDKADADDVKSIQTATGNPITLTDGSETYAQGLSVELEPKQDLHGYDFPWVGGAGKNKLQPTITSQTINGITFTKNSDGSVHITGTSTTDFVAEIGTAEFSEQTGIIYNGISGGTPSTYSINIYAGVYGSDVYEGDSSVHYVSGTVIYYFVIRAANVQIDTTIYPMIRLSTETDDTFAPYSNICPISGYEGVDVEDVGDNLFDKEADDIDDNYYLNQDGTFAPSNSWIISGYIDLLNFSNVVISGYSEGNNNPSIGFYDEDKVFISAEKYSGRTTISASVPLNAKYVRFSVNKTYLDTAMLENGTTASTTYEPFKSRTASVTFGQTVYGGSVDVTNGGTDDEFENLDDFTDIAFHANQGGTYAYEVYIGTHDKKYGVDNLLASLMPVKTSFTDVAEFSIRGFGNDCDIAIKFPKSVVNTPELAKQWCIDNGLQIAFEKATPTTIATPKTDLKLLQDTNNLSTNGTTITIDYIPNNSIGDAVKASEEYTDRRIAELYEMIEALQQNS